MNSAPLVDGALELGFFEALIRGDWQAAAHAVAQAPVGAVTHHALPGTVVEPSSADIDAFGFALPLASFALHFPDLFSISVGGASVPSSSIDLCSTREFRFIGTANSSVYIHIPAEEYPGLFAFLPPAAPSIHQMRASSTKRCTMPLPAFKEALAEAHISEVLVTCYGLKDTLKLEFPNGVGAPPTVAIAEHAQWVRACIRHAPGARLDIGVVWAHENRAPLFSRPGTAGGPSGMRIFPVHVPLQAITKVLRYLRRNPADPQAANMPTGGWLAGTFHVPATFLRRPHASALLHGASISSAPAEFYTKGVLIHPLVVPLGAGIGRSGVASVVLYNNRVKHAAKAVEPEHKFEKMGWGGHRASRTWTRELDMLNAAAPLARSFSAAQFGGIRSEAKVVIEGPNYSFDTAILDGVKAAIFVASTPGSGICLDASISKVVSDALFAATLRLANTRRGQPDLGMHIQGAVNQLGYFVPKASQSRDFFYSGAPIQRLMVPWRASTALAAQAHAALASQVAFAARADDAAADDDDADDDDADDDDDDDDDDDEDEAAAAAAAAVAQQAAGSSPSSSAASAAAAASLSLSFSSLSLASSSSSPLPISPSCCWALRTRASANRATMTMLSTLVFPWSSRRRSRAVGLVRMSRTEGTSMPGVSGK